MKEGSEGRLRASALTAIVTIGALLALAAPAYANHHLVQIRQIHPSDNSIFGGEWVELQMPAAGENLVTPNKTTIRTFNSTASQQSLYVIGAGTGPHPGAPNGQNQRTILISSLFTPAGVAADFVAPPDELQMTGQDGAVCYTENNPPTFTPIDCVAYGDFLGMATIPSAGPPAVETAFEETLERGIGRGCATALDAADDANNSSTDFALSTRAPRNNTMAPTETLCPAQAAPPGTNPGANQKKCKKKKKKKKKKGKSAAAAKCKKKKKKKKK
jgi:hypothetical protein